MRAPQPAPKPEHFGRLRLLPCRPQRSSALLAEVLAQCREQRVAAAENFTIRGGGLFDTAEDSLMLAASYRDQLITLSSLPSIVAHNINNSLTQLIRLKLYRYKKRPADESSDLSFELDFSNSVETKEEFNSGDCSSRYLKSWKCPLPNAEQNIYTERIRRAPRSLQAHAPPL